MKSKDLSEIKAENIHDKMSEWFVRFSGQCSGSKMYELLSKYIANDNDLLQLSALGNQNQPIPNLFLAAIHFLLFNIPSDKLAQFYPSLKGTFEDSADFYMTFKKFALKHSEKIIKLTNCRTVQTNEVRRCAQLLAGLSMISESVGEKPITLIDVGTSSGLNLLLDHYKYSYNSEGTDSNTLIGHPNSELLITCQVKGNIFPKIKVPLIERRVGIDLNPIDLSNPEECLWAKALMWPDQTERMDRLEKAIAIRRGYNFEMLKANENNELKELLIKSNGNDEICIMHSFTLNQFTEAQRKDFQEVLQNGSQQNSIWRMSLEWIGTKQPELKIQKFSRGQLVVDTAIANCHGHGEWIEFKNIKLA